MGLLTALKVSKAAYPENRKSGRHLISDGQGLNLQIMPSGTKSWILRFMLAGKAREMGLGPYGYTEDCVSLSEAREIAAEKRALAKRGIDPIEVRKRSRKELKVATQEVAAAAVTFREVAEDYIAIHKDGWNNAKHRAQWASTLEAYAYPVVGDMPVGGVDADAVERVLKPIWTTKNETASRLRGRIEAILDYAKAKGFRQGDNPARWKGGMQHRLAKVSKTRRVNHHPALHWEKLPSFIRELSEKGGISANALAFCILTAARSGEVRGATWSEIDLTKKVWTIPASRMKAGREHRVPLSHGAIAILRQAEPLAQNKNSFVFPSVRTQKQLSDMAFSQLVRGMNEVNAGTEPPWTANDGRPIVVHGFRSTFRDWCEEATSTPHAVSEAALAHVVGNKVEAAYHRTDHFEKRRILMEEWGNYCSSNLS